MLPDWPDPSKSLNVSVYCLHNMDHYKTMYPGYTGIFVKSTVNRRICAVYLLIYKVHIVDHTLCRPSFAGNDHAARHLMQRPANADRGGPTGAGRHTRGCLRRATESRKTFLLSLELAGMGKGLDVTTTGRTGKNDGGAAEHSLTGNPGVDYLLKSSRAEVLRQGDMFSAMPPPGVLPVRRGAMFRPAFSRTTAADSERLYLMQQVSRWCIRAARNAAFRPGPESGPDRLFRHDVPARRQRRLRP